jgi:hypothetical protein
VPKKTDIFSRYLQKDPYTKSVNRHIVKKKKLAKKKR